MDTDFVYEALPPGHIHLISWLEDDLDGPPFYTLDTFADEDAAPRPSYVALSYCWGASEEYNAITLNGKLHTVGANLCNALCDLHLHRHVVQTHLWVDALCIYQCRTAEKSIFGEDGLCLSSSWRVTCGFSPGID